MITGNDADAATAGTAMSSKPDTDDLFKSSLFKTSTTTNKTAADNATEPNVDFISIYFCYIEIKYSCVFVNILRNINSMFTLTDISVYIFNWKKVSKNSLELYQNIKQIIDNTTIVNCDESLHLDSSIKHIQLDDLHYYGSQYEHAIKDTLAENIFCVIVGDNISNNNFKLIFDNAIKAFNTYNAGIFAPNDKRTSHTARNSEIQHNLYTVPNTDCGFLFINPKIVVKLKNIKYGSLAKYGWGVDVITMKESTKQGLKILRDYSIETNQLDRSTNYNRIDSIKGSLDLQNEYAKLT